jgi:hypothetical protein
MISLFYLLIYLLKKGQMPGNSKKNTPNPNELFKVSLSAKMNQTSEDLCFDNSKDLLVFK